MISLCNDWQFVYAWSEKFFTGEERGETVRLPHTVKEQSLHYALPEDYETVCGYRRKLNIDESLRGKRLFLQFDAAAHIATVYFNGEEICTHRCGYTAFRVEITDKAVYGGENEILVKLDCRENASVPPFGYVIDYLTYGGLYREVWLDVREREYISDIYVTTPTLHRAHVTVGIDGTGRKASLSVFDGEDCLLTVGGEAGQRDFDLTLPDAEPWDTKSPKLYTLQCLLDNGDSAYTNFGFRTAEFKGDGFYLNGEKTFIRGLNRHQSFPYVGYAAPESLQREDARILKHELGCNGVRTSHYPQSQHFIDECDRQGLIVFTELPGWQHVGDEAWKEQAVENVKEMVLQYRNHPSIVLWGVRINESQDDDEFYEKTNALARKLDPSRATSGVRYIEKSHLLEDVYAYNDFSHSGQNAGVKPKEKVMAEKDKALLISEHNGHMFPTKAYDPWQKRQEQALRHGKVLSDAIKDGEHAGCYGWCMFDYATHKDFGSGDRICYHGVMDSFRNPKLAAAIYACQGDAPVLELGSPMDIGDYPGGDRGQVYIFTNADRVDLYKNDVFVRSFEKRELEGLKYGPMLVDDTIGELLKTQEGYEGKQEALLHQCLKAAQKYGMNMPLNDKVKLLWALMRYKMTFAQGMELYGKYVGNWGGEATRWRFDGIKDGKSVISVTKAPGSKLHILAVPSCETLKEGATYDMAAVRIKVLDEYNNVASYAQIPLKLSVEGAAEIVGPDVVTAEGGMCGTYLRTIGEKGAATLTVSSLANATDIVQITFDVI